MVFYKRSAFTELEMTEYKQIPDSDVRSVSASSRPITGHPAHRSRNSSERGLLDTKTGDERRSSVLSSIREAAVASNRVLRYTKMNTWFGESDGPRKHRGWRKAVVAAAILTAVVLLANVTLAIIVAARYGTDAGIGVLYVGDCGLVSRWDTALHLLINILGTCLLGASSFTMQCLSSPSRSETDRAHASRRPLEIGLPSMMNLFHMPRWKAFLWWSLCLSTLPLHLLWNSAIFSTLGANEFNYLVVEESFLSGADYLAPTVLNYTHDQLTEHDVTDPRIYLDGYKQGRYKRVEGDQCADVYMSTFISSYRNFIVVTTPWDGIKMSPGYLFPTFETNFTMISTSGTPLRIDIWKVTRNLFGMEPLWNGSSVLAYQGFLGNYLSKYYESVVLPSTWPCIGWSASFGPTGLLPSIVSGCDKDFVQDQIRQNGSWWLRPWDQMGYAVPQALQAYPVDYCLVEYQGVQQCELQYVSYILFIVVGCNIIKLGCMCASAYFLWNQGDAIFATVGDAVSSYMDKADETTADWCLIDFKTSKAWQSHHLSHDGQARIARGSIYQRKPRIRLFEATTKTRWWTTTILCVGYLSVGIFFLNLAWATMQDNGSSLEAIESNYGLGKVTDFNTMSTQFGPDELSSSETLIASVLFANCFQVGLSITYFLLNSLFTAQCSAMEWASYVSKRKPLRVTWPRGEQRSTYFLNLPYRYGIPLTVTMLALHFLISQSIFLARVRYYRPDGTKSDIYNISTTAYSPLGLLLVVCVASILILALVVHSSRKVDNRIPIHGNSSAVISALSHAHEGQYRNDQDAAVEDCDKEMSEYSVQWGVVRSTNTAANFQNDLDPTSEEDTTRHCAFTADEVDLPELGQRYR